MVKTESLFSDGLLLYITMVINNKIQNMDSSKFTYWIVEFIDWKALGGEYLQVNMYKAGIDTMNAINIISNKAS